MLPLVHGTNSPLIFASLVRYSLLHFHLSHMAVHHLLYHLHYHQLHLIVLVQFEESSFQRYISYGDIRRESSLERALK